MAFHLQPNAKYVTSARLGMDFNSERKIGETARFEHFEPAHLGKRRSTKYRVRFGSVQTIVWSFATLLICSFSSFVSISCDTTNL